MLAGDGCPGPDGHFAHCCTLQPAARSAGLPDFTELVEQVGPSVVNIRTLKSRAGGAQGGGQMDEEMQEFFRRFFGQPMPGVPRQGPRPNQPQEEERSRAAWAPASSSRLMATS
jgi:S1-C subfamily serine protease